MKEIKHRSFYNTESMIKMSKKVHGDLFDYSKSVFHGTEEKTIFICKKHNHEFQQIPYTHWKGNNGCKFCKGEDISKKTKRRDWTHYRDLFVKKFKGKYTYPLLEEELSGHTSTAIITGLCPEHGEFKIKLADHRCGSYCHKCSRHNLRVYHSAEEFVAAADAKYRGRFDYSKITEYKSLNEPLTFICKKHNHEFTTSAANHLGATGGCRKCRMSHGELIIENFLIDNNIEYKHQHWFPDFKHKRRPVTFDFYLPALKTMVEYDGSQHFAKIPKWNGQEGYEQVQERDKMRNDYCNKNGYRMIRIPYWKRKKISDILTKELNLTTPASHTRITIS